MAKTAKIDSAPDASSITILTSYDEYIEIPVTPPYVKNIELLYELVDLWLKHHGVSKKNVTYPEE